MLNNTTNMKKLFIPIITMALAMPLTGCFTMIRTIASSNQPAPVVVTTPNVVTTPTTVVTTPTTVVTTVSKPSTTTTTVVVPQSYDYYRSLDLRAIAAAFAEARNVREFEQLINSARYMVSNLDLNRDGWIDYLRVMETRQGYTHVLYVQAVLGVNVFQNVCTIVAEVAPGARYVQIVGDPFIYGQNYYIDPVFRATPPMYSYMYSNSYTCWSSPYYWNNYPTYYTHPAPVYVTHYEAYVTTYVTNHTYCREVHYGTQVHAPGYTNWSNTASRNDYATQNPTQSFRHNYAEANARVLGESTRNIENSGQTKPTANTNARPAASATTTTTTTTKPTTTTSSTSTRTQTTSSATSSTSTRTQATSTATMSTSSRVNTNTTPVRTPSNVSREPNTTTVNTRVQQSGRTTTTVTAVDNAGNATTVRRVQSVPTSTSTRTTQTTSTRTSSSTRR